MAKNNNLNDFLKDVADSIRTKTNKSSKINPQNFSSEILGIQTGITPTGTISIEENGTYDVAEYGTAEVNVKGGAYNIVQVDGEDGTELHIYDADGGTDTPTTPTEKGEYCCKVVDFDGTIITEEFLSEGDVFTLPQSPAHNGLVFQQWSSPFAIENNKITVADSDVIVGAVYTTASGKSEFDIELNVDTGLEVYFLMDGTKDWGDGTVGTETTHTYTSVGEYTITCDGSAMTDSINGLFFQYYKSEYENICKRARLGSSITNINQNAFRDCNSLEYIIIPKEVVSIGQRAICGIEILDTIVLPPNLNFLSKGVLEGNMALKNVVIPFGVNAGYTAFASMLSGCYSLSEIILPDSLSYIQEDTFMNCYNLSKVRVGDITSVGVRGYQNTLIKEFVKENVSSLGYNAFYGCRNLVKVKLSDSLTDIPQNTFQNCYILSDFNLPTSIVSIGNDAFNNCKSLRKINFPASCNYIGSQSFYYCGVLEYNFSNHTTVPTLSATSAFSGIYSTTKIIVPDALYDEWITATNWSTYENYIYKASEVSA